jgi:hypothetical protein
LTIVHVWPLYVRFGLIATEFGASAKLSRRAMSDVSSTERYGTFGCINPP